MYDQVYQIDVIFAYKKSFIFLCSHYRTVKFHKFANCIEITKSSETKLINLSELECKRSYEGKFVMNGQTLIIVDNLDMLPMYEKLLLPKWIYYTYKKIKIFENFTIKITCSIRLLCVLVLIWNKIHRLFFQKHCATA